MKLIDFSSGASYFRSPGVATSAAIAALKKGKTSYGPTEGIAALRAAIADRYKSDGIGIRANQVLITPGTKQALFYIFSILLKDQDEVVIPTPSWFGFQGLLKHSKGTLVTLPTCVSNEYSITSEALRKVITEHSRILLLTNPANPTGRLYSKMELEAILKVTAQFPDLYIVSDEIYDFDTYGKPYTSIFSCQGAAPERTIVVNGFSKTFAMSGWRIGYLAGPENIIKKCTEFQGDIFSGVSVFIQDAALKAIQGKEEVLSPMLKVLQENRNSMQRGLQSIPHINFYLPDGAYYFFPDFSYYLNKETSNGEYITNSIELCRYLLDQFSIQLSPGDYFGAPGHARMSFAIEVPMLKEGIERLKQALQLLKKSA